MIKVSPTEDFGGKHSWSLIVCVMIIWLAVHSWIWLKPSEWPNPAPTNKERLAHKTGTFMPWGCSFFAKLHITRLERYGCSVHFLPCSSLPNQASVLSEWWVSMGEITHKWASSYGCGLWALKCVRNCSTSCKITDSYLLVLQERCHVGGGSNLALFVGCNDICHIWSIIPLDNWYYHKSLCLTCIGSWTTMCMQYTWWPLCLMAGHAWVHS